jgi:hypothetical protein
MGRIEEEERMRTLARNAVSFLRKHGTQAAAARAAGIPRQTFVHHLEYATKEGYFNEPDAEQEQPIAEPTQVRPRFVPQMAYAKGENLRLVSTKDNRFLFGASGDQHVGSKHYREDVATDLYARYERAGVQAVFNTGNWIDGEASFNKHDIVAHGIDEQARLLARVYPQARGIETYAIWGADHEGWYANREGIDVGSYVEGVMRSQGRNDWHNLGFMEAHVDLVNANTGKIAKLAVVHPGGGSAYAMSYRPQKIIESYEGGEKPAVVLFGHYHKLDPGLVRSVWYFQTGCCQDQTVFMRQKSIEAHVGGGMLALEQDPETGAIIGCSPTMWRYFNRGYYSNRWSKHGPVTQPVRTIGGL